MTDWQTDLSGPAKGPRVSFTRSGYRREGGNKPVMMSSLSNIPLAL